jgi:hypothetical protein
LASRGQSGWIDPKIAADNKAYDAAKAKGGPVDINAIAPAAQHHWYDPLGDYFQGDAARRQNMEKRYRDDNGGAAPSTFVHTSGEALGVRQNNGGNLRSWGSRPVKNGFASFDDPLDGIAAAAENVRAYRDKYGIDTYGGIVDRWAPKGDGKNNPAAYKKFLQGRTGWGPGQKLNEDDPDVMFKLVKAMIAKEQGGDPYSDDLLMTGIRRGMHLPDNDPNGTRERAAGNGAVSVSGSAEIRLVDTSGRPLGRTTAPLTQTQGTPNAAGTGP